MYKTGSGSCRWGRKGYSQAPCPSKFPVTSPKRAKWGDVGLYPSLTPPKAEAQLFGTIEEGRETQGHQVRTSGRVLTKHGGGGVSGNLHF